MSHPRVLITIATFLPLIGGAERQALAHARYLRAHGYEAEIVTLRHERAWPRAEVIDGVLVTRAAGAILGGRQRLPAPLRKCAYLLGMCRAGWMLWRRRRHFDLLCDFQLNWLTLPAALVCRLAGKPLLLALRTGDSHSGSEERPPWPLPEPLPEAAPWLPQADPARQSGDVELLEGMGPAISPLLRRLLRRKNVTIVVLSSRMRAELIARGFAPDRVHCIPNGVDTRHFAPVASPAVPVTTVVCVARLAYQKGIDVLLQAWKLVSDQMPGARLVLVGIGPLREQLAQLVAALGIEGSVEFAGLRENVLGEWRRGTIAVLPSRWEGMPNVLLEAMACGMACVATRVSGSEDLVQPGVTGLLVEPGDYRSLAAALLDLLRDPVLVHHYGRAAREVVLERFSLERVMDEYASLYKRLASGEVAAGEPITVH